MRFYSAFIFTIFAMSVSSCSRDIKPATPYETFATYTKAINKKDTTTMKLLLSSESMKMHEQEAKAQNVTVDEIVKRETLFREGQRKLEFRNEKIDGDTATLEVKTADDRWETVPFVREDGVWKIDKKGYRDRMMQDIEQENQQAEDEINRDRIQP